MKAKRDLLRYLSYERRPPRLMAEWRPAQYVLGLPPSLFLGDRRKHGT
jgi:hypothetical protein